MTDPQHASGAAGDRATFRRNLTRVLAVQVVTLAILWVLQRTFTP
jgi:hypothetical protein